VRVDATLLGSELVADKSFDAAEGQVESWPHAPLLDRDVRDMEEGASYGGSCGQRYLWGASLTLTWATLDDGGVPAAYRFNLLLK
jgi:hypothetical protein